MQSPRNTVEKQLTGAVESARRDAHDHGLAIVEPWYVVRFVVLDAMKMFQKAHNKVPTTMYVPPIVEAALQVDFGRSLKIHGRLRVTHKDMLLGCKPVWDADEFRLE